VKPKIQKFLFFSIASNPTVVFVVQKKIIPVKDHSTKTFLNNQFWRHNCS